jgi:CheY-like chemotaxis protein
MLSHELRNPLAPILTILELLEMRGGIDERSESRGRGPAGSAGGEGVRPLVIDGRSGEGVRPLVIDPHSREVLDRQVRHLMRLVDDLLDVSRIARGKIELDRRALSLATPLDHAVDMARPLLESKRVTLIYERPAADLVITGDLVRLAQVFGNVLANAAHYTQPGGTVSIGVRRSDDLVAVAIRDNGNGIAPDVLPRIFELFEQGHRQPGTHGGLGIGLSVCRSLVELHGGTISAASDGPGRGSEFVIALRLGAPAPSVARLAPRPAPVAPAARNVLVVDDNTDAAELLADALSLHGYHVTVSHDGERALAMVKQSRPDIVLLDIGLPGIDGYEVARRIRALTVATPLHVVALSGYGQSADREKSRASGFDAHLVKPVDIQKLLGMLAAAR